MILEVCPQQLLCSHSCACCHELASPNVLPFAQIHEPCIRSKEGAHSLNALQDPGKAKGSPGIVFAAAAAQLQLRLLETYLALPDASAFTMEHAAVSKLCARALRYAPGQVGSGTVTLVTGSCFLGQCKTE